MIRMRGLCRTLFFLVFLALIAGCGQKPIDQLTFSGTLEITEHLLGAKAAGRVRSIMVDEGDPVKAGQLIATLDRFDQARRDYGRAKELFRSGGGNRQAVEYARLDWRDQAVLSPVSGIVLVKVHEIGEVVPAGSALVVVGDTSDQWVRIFVPEGYINRVKLNQKAVLSFDGISKTFSGHVRTIATKAEFTPRNVQTPEERVTQAFAVKVALDEPQANVHPGVAVDVRFTHE